MREKKQTPVRRETKKNTHQTIDYFEKTQMSENRAPHNQAVYHHFPDKHMQYSI